MDKLKDRHTWRDCYDGTYTEDIIQHDYDGATVFTGDAVDRLAEYEDLGFTPLEIKYMLQCGARAAGFPLESCIPEGGVRRSDIDY